MVSALQLSADSLTGRVEVDAVNKRCGHSTEWTGGPIRPFAESVGMAELAYTVILEPEPDGSAWNVTVPALPEIHTFGKTQAEALDMARDAIALSLAYRRDEGMEIPPSDANRTRLATVTVTAA